MKLSVAMCTYDGERFLREQLESIELQTRPPDELVICDDRSTDSTREILEAFSARVAFPVRLYVNEETLGTVKNFEKAIGLCRGEIIALADQDDVWHAEKLKRMEDVFAQDADVGLVFSDAEIVDENLEALGVRLWQLVFKPEELREIRRGRAFEVFLKKRFSITGATVCFRSRLKQFVLPLPVDTYMIHDGWLGLMISAVAQVRLIELPLVKYRQHAAQQTGAILKPYEASNQARADFFREESESYLREVPVLSRVLREVVAHCNGDREERIRALEERIEFLRGAATHNRARASANALERRIKRVPFIIRELLAFRYHRFGRGLRSAAGDFLRH